MIILAAAPTGNCDPTGKSFSKFFFFFPSWYDDEGAVVMRVLFTARRIASAALAESHSPPRFPIFFSAPPHASPPAHHSLPAAAPTPPAPGAAPAPAASSAPGAASAPSSGARVDPLKHGRVLQHVGDDEKPNLAPSKSESSSHLHTYTRTPRVNIRSRVFFN